MAMRIKLFNCKFFINIKCKKNHFKTFLLILIYNGKKQNKKIDRKIKKLVNFLNQ